MIKGKEIASIRITAWEKGGVEDRIGYYDQVGAMKDMIQSHLLQILSLITMDIPVNCDIAGLHREKNNILSAVRFSGKKEDVLFGQFRGYNLIAGVGKNSQTDTFARLKLSIDRRDWFNVPVVIETGKRLNRDKTVVDIEFKKMASQDSNVASNRLVFEMKPDEKIHLKLIQHRNNRNREDKKVFENIMLEQGLMCQTDFCLGDYASLLNDIFQGEKIYFLSYPEIVAAWKVIDSVEKLRSTELTTIIYEEESDGENIN
jgi:glucose-6-phosphate 1-dehydrogenase